MSSLPPFGHARGTSTISLVERQIEVMREKHAAIEGKLAELVAVARGNDAIAAELRRFIAGDIR